MTKLSVNLNKFALLRNSRDKDLPNLVAMAQRCIRTGVHGITVHPRPDQRHTRYQDVFDLAAVAAEQSVEFNIEGNPTPFFLDIVKKVKPTQCTLVPDAPQQLTSDHGWDLHRDGIRLQPIIADLKEAGIRASLFLDPDLAQVDRVPPTGADRIELYTEAYADAFGGGSQDEVLAQLPERCAPCPATRPGSQCRTRLEPQEPEPLPDHPRNPRSFHRPCHRRGFPRLRPGELPPQVSHNRSSDLIKPGRRLPNSLPPAPLSGHP